MQGTMMDDESVDVDGGQEHWTLHGGGATGLLSLNAAAAAKAGRQRPTNNALLCVLKPLRKAHPSLGLSEPIRDPTREISPERPVAV